ncbi:MAG: non-homologous end-joining DNA ligase, partial [Chloroflexi bacterium]|nr:non-homologous end-joining DNA ligase [Chloroflexota bacterium]
MGLERYRAKRDFGRTPEPGGPAPAAARGVSPATAGKAGPASPLAATPGGAGRFVIGRHRATRLHYDLRLEIAGVLASWAVPKGPSLDPGVRRAAFRTEDHPLEYLDFEGVIPRGEYGAGDAIAWDWGTFEPEAATLDPAAAVRAGELKLRLRGEKVRGRFTLVRTGGRDDGRTGAATSLGDEEGAAWLLIHKRDVEALGGWDAENHPASVRTGRTNEEVAAGLAPRFQRAAPGPLPTLDVPGSVAGAQPDFVPPMLAMSGRAPFDDQDWLFEPKWDGYRVQAVVADGRLRLWTRNRADAAAYFPELGGPPDWIAATEAIVDGEVVALDDDGSPDFGLLQARLGGAPGRSGRSAARGGASPGTREAGRAAPLVYQVFDLLWCEGRSLLGVALEERKELLRLVLRDHPRVRYGGHVEADGVAFFGAAAERGLEGVMAKQRRSRYEAGRRSPAWLKLKVRPTQELVVGGFVPGRGSHRDLGALLVGVMDDGRLRYAGRVGSGIDAATRARLRAALTELAQPEPPFEDGPPDLGRTPGAHWAAPRLVIRAEIGGWSRDGIVRQATFAGQAADVEPASVERQEAVGPEAAERALARARGTTQVPAAPKVTPAPTAPAAGATGTANAPPVPVAAAGPPSLPAPSAAELAALDALPGRGGTWRVGGHEVTLTNLDKVLAPGGPAEPAGTAAGAAPARRRGAHGPENADAPGAHLPTEPPVTKRDLVRYFVEIGPTLLPHLAGRPLNLTRFPDGIDGERFWQKALPGHAPAWLARWREPDPPDRRAHTYLVADGLATLAWLGNQAAIEIHPWTSPTVAPERPLFALFDIDPGEATTWGETLVLARLVRRALEHLGVVGLPKVTGKRGIQVFVPLAPRYSFADTQAWVEGVSRAVGGAVPDLVSWEWAKDRRGGRARLDYTQNWRNRTLVAPYSP